jgi:N-acyl homoserine lactone hydrolase
LRTSPDDDPGEVPGAAAAMSAPPKPVAMPLRAGRAGATVRIHPLLTGEILAPSGFFKRPGGPLGRVRGLGLHVPRRRWRWCPIPAFLVEHPSEGALLIDTGLDASVLRDPGKQFGPLLKRLFELRVAPGQDAVSQARERGVEAAAIRTVVLTHLHYDHAGAAGQLPHATFLFDRREWAPAVRGRLLEGYRRETVDRPLDWRTLNFDAASPGAGFARTLDLLGDGSVRLVSTPGHSHGHMSVVLRTASGPLLLAGDAAYTRRAIAEGHDQLARADLAAYRDSLKTLRRWADANPAAPIICSHDHELWPNLPALYA